MFTKYIYQPIFNLIAASYWLVGKIDPSSVDVGVAVILFAALFRILLLPLTVSGDRSEKERRQIMEKINQIKESFIDDPIKERKALEQVLERNSRIVYSTTINLVIQFLILVALYRFFTEGVGGKDFNLLYSWAPKLTRFNYLFLGEYNLTKHVNDLNLIQSALIFLVQFLIGVRSPTPVKRREITVTIIVFPIISYLIFLTLPSGITLFVITSLAGSALYNTYRLLRSLAGNINIAPPGSAHIHNPPSNPSLQEEKSEPVEQSSAEKTQTKPEKDSK